MSADVLIPAYDALDVPYSQWEAHRGRELLSANGFGDDEAEWLRAAEHESGLLRETAYYLLTRERAPEREALYRRGLGDRDESVRALAGYGLLELGDASVLPLLESLARQDVASHTAAARAAGILGQAGHAAAFATLHCAMASDEGYVRLFAIENATPFVDLHGSEYAAGKTIDVWRFYERALRDPLAQVREVARRQLRELDGSRAAQLLQAAERGATDR